MPKYRAFRREVFHGLSTIPRNLPSRNFYPSVICRVVSSCSTKTKGRSTVRDLYFQSLFPIMRAGAFSFPPPPTVHGNFTRSSHELHTGSTKFPYRLTSASQNLRRDSTQTYQNLATRSLLDPPRSSGTFPPRSALRSLLELKIPDPMLKARK